ncbi:MAG: DnaB-like helicase N-terminal domain-containing protein, partial [Anaerolineales bacterium]
MADDFYSNDESLSEALTLPSNRDAEEALIGAVLISKDVFLEVSQFLKAEDFF